VPGTTLSAISDAELGGKEVETIKEGNLYGAN
jgi:hypothetical protein